MLPAGNRVRQSRDFSSAFGSGVRAGTRFLVVHVDGTSGSHAPRVGFVVSKAVGNAVTRNRVKRRLRAIMAAQLNDLPPAIYVVRAQPAAAGASFSELTGACRSTLRKALAKAGRSYGE